MTYADIKSHFDHVDSDGNGRIDRQEFMQLVERLGMTRSDDIVDMAFVQEHVSIPMTEGVMLIDARPYKPKYIKGHIPMAVSIPDSQFDKMTDNLPADKNSLLIFYCGGLKCKLSHKSAMKAEKLGYTNVKVFAEGYPAWMADKTH